MTVRGSGWTAVVVFKGRGASKTRLEHDSRSALAEAFLLDTLAAVRAAREIGSIVLVTSDAGATGRARSVVGELAVLPDPGSLNTAVATGVAAALLARPEGPVVALTGDLPALAPGDLDAALRLARSLPAVVADRAGTGTTALLVASDAEVEPAFGAGSLHRHRSSGCAVLDLPVSSTLRLDVDTVDDLRDAEALGVGPHTTRELAAAA